MAEFDAAKARDAVLQSEQFEETALQRYYQRPFDEPWCYFTSVRPIWNRARPELEAVLKPDNAALVSRAYRERPHDEDAYRNIPDAVWNFTIGGYQVLKKWLSYRERKLLGRALTPGEVRDVARRLRLMTPELDANYRACAAAHTPLTSSP